MSQGWEGLPVKPRSLVLSKRPEFHIEMIPQSPATNIKESRKMIRIFGLSDVSPD